MQCSTQCCSCLAYTWPLSQDLPDGPWSCKGPGRSEKLTGQPGGIWWRICPLLPLFLTSSLENLPPSVFISHFFLLLHFYSLAFLHLLRPPPQLQQKPLKWRGQETWCSGRKLQKLRKKKPSGYIFWSSWSPVMLQRCANSICRCRALWSFFSFCGTRASVPLPWEQPCGFASPPTVFVESRNGLGWEGPSHAIQSNPPAMSRDIFNCIRLLKAPSNLALHIFWWSTGTGCPGRFWSLLLWRYPRPAWTRSCAACCRWPCFGRGVGLYDPQRSLPTPNILWFCDSVKGDSEVLLGIIMSQIMEDEFVFPKQKAEGLIPA